MTSLCCLNRPAPGLSPMRFAALLVAASLLTLLLAGCTGSDSSDPSSSPATTAPRASATAAPSSAPASSAPPSSAPPSSSGASSSRSVGLAADRLSGAAPLAVNFTVTSTGPAPVSFVLAFGDGESAEGAAFPATVAHTYTATGGFVALLTATYGDGAKRESSLSLAATAPAVGSNAPLLNKTFAFTIPVSWAGGLATSIALCGSPVPGGDAIACQEQQPMTAYQNDFNKTYLVGYEIVVAEGAASLFVEAGTTVAQTCDPADEGLCVPDMDLYLYDPAGVPTAVGTAAAFEIGLVEAPAPGTWTILLVYFAGAPNQASTTHIVVR